MVSSEENDDEDNLFFLAVEPVYCASLVGEDEKCREDQSRTSAVLYATFNSFIYVFVLEHF